MVRYYLDLLLLWCREDRSPINLNVGEVRSYRCLNVRIHMYSRLFAFLIFVSYGKLENPLNHWVENGLFALDVGDIMPDRLSFMRSASVGLQ